jgi:hypothetical protein
MHFHISSVGIVGNEGGFAIIVSSFRVCGGELEPAKADPANECSRDRL